MSPKRCSSARPSVMVEMSASRGVATAVSEPCARLPGGWCDRARGAWGCCAGGELSRALRGSTPPADAACALWPPADALCARVAPGGATSALAARPREGAAAAAAVAAAPDRKSVV
jgi:hypothetical protein